MKTTHHSHPKEQTSIKKYQNYPIFIAEIAPKVMVCYIAYILHPLVTSGPFY